MPLESLTHQSAEASRLAALVRCKMLDTPPEPRFDEIVELAAAICDRPIAVITLIDRDRQWFKARHGLPMRETARDIAICAHAIQQKAPMQVVDLLLDPRFVGNPMVTQAPYIRAYVGVPLIDARGHALGALAVMDTRPGCVDARQLRSLTLLAQRAMRQLGEASAGDLAMERALAGQFRIAHARLAEAQAVAKIGSWDTDLTSLSLAWSDETFRIFEVEPGQLGTTYADFLELVHPADRDQVDAQFRQSINGDPLREFQLEHRRITRSGIKQVQQRWRNHYAADGSPLRSVGTVQDITERKCEQERLLRLGRMHEVLSGVNQLIVCATDCESLFSGCCRIAAEHGKFGAAWIDAYDPQTQTLQPVALAGVDSLNVVPGKRHADPDADGLLALAARAAMRGSAVLCNEATECHATPCPASQSHAHGYRSGISLPLIAGGKVRGVLSLLAAEADFFDADEIKLLDELAADISLALDRLARVEHIRYLAHYDVLTGLPNRELFLERLRPILDQADQRQCLGAVVHLDVQRLHDINNTFGRQQGDSLLKLVAKRLSSIMGERGAIARIAGDHFVFVLSGQRDATELAHGVQAALNHCFERPFDIDAHQLRVMARAGIAVFPQDGADAETLLKNAESALNEAKTESAQFLFYTPQMNAQVAATLLLESKLRVALEQNQFVLHYQPKFDMASGAMTGVEGLIRWNDPDGGMVQPLDFIPILEDSGLILPVGEWALREAIADYQRWRDLVPDPPRIAVNVSSLQLRQADFVDVVRREIGGAGNSDHGLDLEITESVLMAHVDANIQKLDEVRRMGVRVAIDDFGTGYSSLLYLAKLPLDSLKVDRSFIIRMSEQDSDLAIVSTIVSLAHRLGLSVIAEGVDAAEQAQLLAGMQCDEMQGFLFSKPVPAQVIDRLLARSESLASRSSRFSMN